MFTDPFSAKKSLTIKVGCVEVHVDDVTGADGELRDPRSDAEVVVDDDGRLRKVCPRRTQRVDVEVDAVGAPGDPG